MHQTLYNSIIYSSCKETLNGFSFADKISTEFQILVLHVSFREYRTVAALQQLLNKKEIITMPSKQGKWHQINKLWRINY
jgi:hypothetical protein